MSLPARAILGLVLGLTAGIAISVSREPSLLALASAIEPIGTLWVNAIRMTVIPLVVSLLITGIASTANVRTIGRTGGRAFLLFLTFLAPAAIFTTLLAIPAFERLPIDPGTTASLRATTSSAATPASELPTFTDWLVGLVPVNPIKAAADGAMLPLIIFTLAFAVALTRTAPEVRELAVRFFRGIADAMLVLVHWILLAAPLGVFTLTLALAARLGYTAAGAVGYYLIVQSALIVIVLFALYPVAVLVGRVPLRQFAQATFPAQAVAFSARSSFAALPALIDGAQRKLRLPSTVTSFVLPFAVSTLRLSAATSWTVGALFIARFYGIDLGAREIATFAAASVAMSFSIPGIPSGGLFIQAPFFMAIGLPVEGIAILIALDAIPDILKGVLNVTAHMTVATVLAHGSRQPLGGGGLLEPQADVPSVSPIPMSI